MRPNDTEMQTSEALFTKIYAVRVFEASRVGRAFSSFRDAPFGAGPESILRSWLWIPGSRIPRPGMPSSGHGRQFGRGGLNHFMRRK